MHDHELTRTLTWRGRTIAWDAIGHGPPVVLLHGTPWSSALWAATARRLAEQFTVYLWDMPGYGVSSKDPTHTVDLGIQAEAFSDLLAHWQLTRPHVIAHDFGGAVSLRGHLLHGLQYASLCLVDVVALRPWGSPFFRLVKEHAAVFEQLPPAIHRGAIAAYISGASHRGLAPDDLDALVRPWTGDDGQPAFYRQIAQADERYTAEVESAYGAIDIPTHIVWGAEDTWIPPDRADRLHATIPGSSLAVIADAGHLIQLDAAEQLTAELLRWLQTQPAVD